MGKAERLKEYVGFALCLPLDLAQTNRLVAFVSNPIDQNLLENKKERLHIQREVLHLMKASHIDWTKSATDAETKRIHEVMVELIKEMAAHCEHLLDTFQAQDNK